MNTQLTLFSEPEINQPCSLSNSDSEPKLQSLLRFLGKHDNDSNGVVGIYQPGKRKSKYFRYSIRIGNKMKHHHIPGGNILNQLAQLRAREIKEMINSGRTYFEIVNTIQNFNHDGILPKDSECHLKLLA
ncbi:hypothetical protein STA3757_30580 [Stanieria sp. NIES-3757]|nr:hypothetical protein STA3757_30580 [Stanieria sp. NIES-3757]